MQLVLLQDSGAVIQKAFITKVFGFNLF